jgi:hypothetical protein
MMDRRTFLATASAAAVVTASSPARAELPSIKFRELYRQGRELTDAAAALVGRRIAMNGYMAPPLKPEVPFFVLTKLPMATCPFCSDAADWPIDLVVAYAKNPIEVVRFSDLIRAEGVFESGVWTDPDTGFVSLLRLQDVTYTRI